MVDCLERRSGGGGVDSNRKDQQKAGIHGTVKEMILSVEPDGSKVDIGSCYQGEAGRLVGKEGGKIRRRGRQINCD